MEEIMRRIAELRAFRHAIARGCGDPDVQPAALDWLDGVIAEHAADLFEMRAAG